jgi:hypothetical protein
MVENRARAVNVKWRAELIRGPRKIDIFAIEFAVAILKRMHWRM